MMVSIAVDEYLPRFRLVKDKELRKRFKQYAYTALYSGGQITSIVMPHNLALQLPCLASTTKDTPLGTT